MIKQDKTYYKTIKTFSGKILNSLLSATRMKSLTTNDEKLKVKHDRYE